MDKIDALLGYNFKYAITHPHVMFSDYLRELKWAWQRIFLGFDWRIIWSIDIWLVDIMLVVLPEFKKVKHGIPLEFLGKPNNSDDGYENSDEVATELWDKEIDKMILGFRSAKEIIDGNYMDVGKDWKQEYDRLEKLRKEGMYIFVDQFFSLWD